MTSQTKSISQVCTTSVFQINFQFDSGFNSNTMALSGRSFEVKIVYLFFLALAVLSCGTEGARPGANSGMIDVTQFGAMPDGQTFSTMVSLNMSNVFCFVFFKIPT